MGGDISLKSVEGRGSTFCITFKNIRVPSPGEKQDVFNVAPEQSSGSFSSPSSRSTVGIQSTELSAASAKEPVQLPLLVERLEGGLTSRWNLIKRTLMPDEVQAFAKEVRELGETHHLPILVQWGNRLFKEIKGFEMRKVGQTIQSFPELVEAVRTLASGDQ